MPGIEAVLEAVREYDNWTQLMFLLTGDIRLKSKTPLEVLQASDHEAVIKATQADEQHSAA